MRYLKLDRDLYILILNHISFVTILTLNWINPNNDLIFLRALVAIAYITIVPGYLLVRRFFINSFNDFTVIVIHSIGLSLSLIMFIGLILNTVTPYLGVKNPINDKILAITFFVINTFLILLNVKQKNRIYNIVHGTLKNLKKREYIQYLAILLTLPTISIVGSFEFIYNNSNNIYILLLFLILIISIVVVYNTKISTKFYPVVILSISIALQLYGSLSSKYVCVIGDSEVEYHYANLVLLNGVWQPDIYANQNAMLSITMLLPIYTILSGLDLNFSFKILYPFVFSITPIVMYKLLTTQFNERISLISCFLFMFSFQFYNAYALSVRWGIGLIFFILSMYLLIIQDNTRNTENHVLLIVYSLALIVSHYGTSYLFMFTIIPVFLLHNLLFKQILKINQTLNQTLSFDLGYVLFYIVACLSYYMISASSSPFNISITFLEHIFYVIRVEFLSPKASQILFALEREWPISIKISQFVILFLVLITVIGLLSTLFYYLFRNRNADLSISNTYLLISSLLVIYSFISTIQSMFTPQRIYFIALPLIAPFSIVGLRTILYFLYYLIFNRRRLPDLLNISEDNNIVKLFMLILVIYFMFTSGVASETLIKDSDYPLTVFMAKNRIDNISDPYFIYALNRRCTPEVDVSSAIWLSSNRDTNRKIYVDMGGHGKGYIGWAPLYSYGMINLTEIDTLDKENKFIKIGSYVYLRQYSCTKKILFRGPPWDYYNISRISLQNMHKVFDNGACIYLFTEYRDLQYT